MKVFTAEASFANEGYDERGACRTSTMFNERLAWIYRLACQPTGVVGAELRPNGQAVPRRLQRERPVSVYDRTFERVMGLAGNEQTIYMATLY